MYKWKVNLTDGEVQEKATENRENQVSSLGKHKEIIKKVNNDNNNKGLITNQGEVSPIKPTARCLRSRRHTWPHLKSLLVFLFGSLVTKFPLRLPRSRKQHENQWNARTHAPRKEPPHQRTEGEKERERERQIYGVSPDVKWENCV